MDVVFRFASRILVWSAAASWSRARRRRSRATSACARSISAKRTMAEALLELKDVRAGYGDAVVLDGVSLEVPENGSLAVLGRNGVGKSTLLLTDHGLHPASCAATSTAAARTSPASPRTGAPSSASAGWRRSARSFPRSSLEENLTVAARPGAWDLAAVYELFPRLDGAQGQHGQPALRRRAADARHRARADDQPRRCCCSTSRSRAWRRSSSRSWPPRSRP